jgi:hypothetical protein
MTVHVEKCPFAGQKNATKGKAGLSRPDDASRTMLPLMLPVMSSALRFRLGRCDGAILVSETETYHRHIMHPGGDVQMLFGVMSLK